jgi:hypothetical protein
MTLPLDKFSAIERLTSRERGKFSLFALFLREDSDDKWDFLAAAPWIEKNKWFAYRYFSKKLAETLTEQELLMLSRIVIIELKNPMLNAIHSAFKVEIEKGGYLEVRDSNLFGFQIKHAYFFASEKLDKENRLTSRSS